MKTFSPFAFLLLPLIILFCIQPGPNQEEVNTTLSPRTFSRNAVAICTYPGDFHYVSGYNVSAVYNDEVDVILVLAYFDEAPLVPFPGLFLLFLEAFVPRQVIKQVYASRSHATFKSFAALHYLSTNNSLTGSFYTHVAVVDSEVQFCNFEKLSESFSKLFERKRIIGGVLSA